MLLRLLQGIVLGLVVLVACNDKGKDEKGAEDSKYKFSMESDNNLLNDGKGKIELQLMQDGKAVTKLAASIDITLEIVCDTDQKAEFKGKLGKDGKASIDVDLSNKEWGEVDWRACKISATASVDGNEVKAKDVELKTISAKDAGPDDDEDKLPQFKIGEEIGGQSLGGKLSLHGCGNANLYVVSKDSSSVSRDADGVIEADSTTKSFPDMFVLGVAGDKCKLQHTAKGETTAKDWAEIKDAAVEVENNTWDNKAAGHAVGIEINTSSNDMIVVTLPSANKPASAHVYVSGDGGAISTKHDSANWDDTPINTIAATGNNQNEKLHNALVMIKVNPTSDDTSNAKVWWHMYGLNLDRLVKFAVGMTTAVKIAASDAGHKIQVRVAEGRICGMHFFHLKANSDQTDYTPRRISAAKYVDINVAADTDAFELLPIDGGGATYTAGCKIGLNINGISYMAVDSAQDASRPDITGIEIAKGGTGMSKVKVSLPAWNSNWGHSLVATKIKASNDGGDSWKTYGNTVAWKDTANSKTGEHVFGTAPYDVSWHSTATNNQALVWAKIELRQEDAPPPSFWYYSEGS